MKRILSITLIIFIILLFAAGSGAGDLRMSKISVRVIKTTQGYTYYSWRARVNAYSSSRFNCFIHVSHLDKDGYEIHSDDESFLLRGSKIATGQGMCETSIYNQFRDHTAELTCYPDK